jgi:phospholipid/cholesterol/gamma-HCH transport system ATP-binding protein
MIRISGIGKSFGNTSVLRNISAEFTPGKANLIIGKSGAGKTVLLKLLVGLLTPDEGQIFYDKVNFLTLRKKELRILRMKVGMLFQGSALFDSMTVEENIRFPLDMFTEMTKKEKTDRVNTCLNRVSLDGINAKFPSELSGGMQKRVGIARAIVLNPSYLFCDEPNSGLDPKTSLVIDELIKDITKENNITTIINTHDMNSVMEVGENVILLHEGQICWQGHKDEIMLSDNEILQDFIFASPFLQRLRQAALSQDTNINAK